MKNRTKILISILAGFIVLLGCGVWLFQSLRSEPAPAGEEAAPLTNLTAMLNAHDTIVTAQYQESSDPYTTDGGESWQVDSTYTVQESLRGQLQPGDSVTFPLPLSSQDAKPYSEEILETATDSTLLFLKSDGETYRISLPFLSLQPVQAAGADRIINWMNGVERRNLPDSNRRVVLGKEASPTVGTEQTLNWCERTRQFVSTMKEMYNAVYATDETAPALVDESDVVLLGMITEVSSPYEKEGGCYRDFTIDPQILYKDPKGLIPFDPLTLGDPFTIPVFTGTEYESGWEGLRILLLKEENGALRLTGSVYDSVCALGENDTLLWFGSEAHPDVNGGMYNTGDLETYCATHE